jgi:hypothetical protein
MGPGILLTIMFLIYVGMRLTDRAVPTRHTHQIDGNPDAISDDLSDARQRALTLIRKARDAANGPGGLKPECAAILRGDPCARRARGPSAHKMWQCRCRDRPRGCVARPALCEALRNS